MIELELNVINRLGLHARAAAKLVKTASRYEASISLSKDGKSSSAKSIMGIMMLAAAQGSAVNLTVEGPDQEDAAQAVQALFADRFGEAD